jgi:glycosyltransferase involved in cell wall biosynthesis
MTESSIQISVCIPTYNQTHYLRKTLDSVFRQNGVSFEVIITDDSSTEDVFDLINEYSIQYTNIKYIRNKPSLGSPYNWNFAVSIAEGEFIKILHHDEWFVTNDALIKFINVIKVNPFALVVSSSYLQRGGIESVVRADEITIEKIKKEPQNLILGNVFGSPSSVLFHRSLIQSFDTNFVWLVDVEFYIRFLLTNKDLIYIKEPLYCSAMDQHNITNSCLYNTELQLVEYCSLFNKYIYQMPLYKRIIFLLHIYKILLNSHPKKKIELFLRLIKRTFLLRIYENC